MMFGELSTGAHNDLLRATDIARSMVVEYGMSDAVGPVNDEGRTRSLFLESNSVPERGAYAEETARTIDAEVRRFVSNAESRAAAILNDHRASLDLIVAHLDKEVIEGDELRFLIESLKPVGALIEPSKVVN